MPPSGLVWTLHQESGCGCREKLLTECVANVAAEGACGFVVKGIPDGGGRSGAASCDPHERVGST